MSEAKTQGPIDVDKLEAEFEADPGNLVVLAKAYVKRNLPDQAIRVCQRGLRRNPAIPNGRLALAMAYYHNFDDRRAEIELREALRSDPKAFVAHRSLGEIYLDRRQDQKALAELVKAQEIEPRDPYTRALLESMEEKVPAAKGNGVPEDNWPVRRLHHTRVPPKPMWHNLAQVMVVLLAMVALLFWYQHAVAIEVEVREALKRASAATPPDNFDNLLQAEVALKEAMALDSDQEKARVRIAFVQSLLYRYHGQADRMASLREQLAWMDDEDVPNPERFALRGLMMMADNKPEEAAKYLGDIITRAIEQKDIFLNAMVFGVRGEAFEALGQMDKAREEFSRATRFSGDSPHYQAEFAEVYLREGILDRALKYFRDALRANPNHVFSNIRVAYATVLVGRQLDIAKKILDDLLDPAKYPEAEFSPPMRGLLFSARAEYALAAKEEGPDAAAGWLSKALATWDANAEAHDLAGRLAAFRGDGAAASAAFAKSLQIDPRQPKTYFDRAESLFALGQQQDALDKLREFERFLKPTVGYHVKRGDLMMRMGNLETAAEEFSKAIGVDELSPTARFHLALAYQQMGERLGEDKDKKEQKLEFYNKAREEYENSIMLPGGERPEVYRQMGLIYLDNEDFENAMEKLAQAALMMGKNGESSDRIAEIYVDISKIFKAMGGTEGEKQEKAYLAKAEALRAGKTVEQVEQEWADQEKKKSSKPRRGRRR